jgi:hypothetical protein
MPSILWGDDEGADVCLPFNGHCSLSGCQILNAGAADDDLALAFDRNAVDANTVFAYRMDEAAWNGTAGEVIDAGPGGLHATAQGGATTAAGALGRYGDMGVAHYNDHVLTPTIAWPSDTFCLEFWAYVVGSPNVNHHMLGTSNNVDRPCELRVNVKANPTNWEWRGYYRAKFINCPNGAWVHWTLQASKSANTMRAWLNGQNVLDTTAETRAAGNITFGLGKAVWSPYGVDVWMDDVRLSNVARRATAANFTAPVWRKSASQNGGVQPYGEVSGSGLAGMLPTAVSWTAQTGSAYGRVHSVWVNDVTGGWTQVGGAYPTSPVSVAGLTLASDDAVRVALEPEAVSGIQNASPTLYGVRLDWAVPSVSFVPRRITPVRIGPRLLPIGVIC